jgi:hypothetical protein
VLAEDVLAVTAVVVELGLPAAMTVPPASIAAVSTTATANLTLFMSFSSLRKGEYIISSPAWMGVISDKYFYIFLNIFHVSIGRGSV